MSKITKNQKEVKAKYDHSKLYTLSEACALLKEISFAKFDSTVELSCNLGVDPRKANQMIRGVVTLPNGTGKVVRVLALCTPDKEAEAKAAGADYVGLDDYVEKIKGGWTDIDVIVCTPSVMAKVGALGRILGPRGLMPNPKTGTVTMEIGNAVKDVKGGKIDFKVDKAGIVHCGIGKISFTPEQIYQNAAEVLNAISKLKPQALKGTYMKSAAICTTMSPGVKVDLKAFLNNADNK
ncbi:MAG: 50S ribosomal protein L1 [Bacteroidales bacterium]|nr:50S ribosomal protein L1 [Bacteroidales bacterium]